jgi:hypothetical protein
MGLLSRITSALTPSGGRKAPAPAGSAEVSLGQGAGSGTTLGISTRASGGTGPSWSIDMEAS